MGQRSKGTLAIDALLSPAALTWTARREILRSVAGGEVYQAVAEDLAAIKGGMLQPSTLAAIGIGWSEANGGVQQQANVMKVALVAAKDQGVTAGLGTGIDWSRDQCHPIEANHGILAEDGSPNPGSARSGGSCPDQDAGSPDAWDPGASCRHAVFDWVGTNSRAMLGSVPYGELAG